jgi:hypothetical protein
MNFIFFLLTDLHHNKSTSEPMRCVKLQITHLENSLAQNWSTPFCSHHFKEIFKFKYVESLMMSY